MSTLLGSLLVLFDARADTSLPAIYEVGCLAGAVFALMFGDRLGRRKMMFSGAIILVIGVIIQITAFSGSWAGGQFIIGRISKSDARRGDFQPVDDQSALIQTPLSRSHWSWNWFRDVYDPDLACGVRQGSLARLRRFHRGELLSSGILAQLLTMLVP